MLGAESVGRTLWTKVPRGQRGQRSNGSRRREKRRPDEAPGRVDCAVKARPLLSRCMYATLYAAAAVNVAAAAAAQWERACEAGGTGQTKPGQATGRADGARGGSR
jgi:hypothetical protein